MAKLHTFGCSITQGFALPDVVKPVLNSQGQPLTNSEIEADPNISWTDIHLYQPSVHAWPQVLGDLLGLEVENHARRGACFRQIARQVAVAAPRIEPDDVAIVMWTYCSRLSLQWPSRTSVPFCTEVDTTVWRSVTRGFNKLFGLEPRKNSVLTDEQRIHKYIEQSVLHTHLNPMAVYDRYYNNLITQTLTAGTLAAQGARTIHTSVEPESVADQIELARTALDESLQDYVLPTPQQLNAPTVDHTSCRVILDPSIPTAENDMHPSVQHHSNFATHLRETYFS